VPTHERGWQEQQHRGFSVIRSSVKEQEKSIIPEDEDETHLVQLNAGIA